MDEKNVTLSVILVSYNEAQYLPVALDSCLKQSLNNIEIIIGDDGSSDESIEIIKNYEKTYPNIVYSFVMDRPEESEGIIASLRVSNIIKKGLDYARGRFVSILSGDDFFCDNEKFKRAVEFLDRNKNYSAYVSGYKKVYQDSTEAYYRSSYPPVIFWGGIYLHISSFVFRHDIYEQGLILNRFCDDTGLIYSIGCNGKWKYENEITFAYRQREHSIMHSMNYLEMNIFEVMLFQDILCKNDSSYNKYMLWASYARFAIPCISVWKQRKDLCRKTKYLVSCEKYNYDIYKWFLLYDNDRESKKKINRLLLKMWVCHFIFQGIRKAYKLFTVTEERFRNKGL